MQDAILHMQTRDTKIQGCEVKVRQLRVKSAVQTLRTESGVDFTSDSGSLGLYLQHFRESAMATTEECRDGSKFTCSSLDRAIR